MIVFLFYRRTLPQIFGWQKYLLISLRSIALITLLTLLFNPIFYYVNQKIVKPKIVILNDVSESMQQKIGAKSKAEHLAEINNKILLKCKNCHKMEFNFAAGIEGNKNSTNLNKTISELADKTNLKNVKSIFLFSDGWFSDENLSKIEKLNIPIYTFNPHIESVDFDISISELRYNKTAYINEPTPLNISLQAENYSEFAKVKLLLNNEIIATKKVNFNNSNFEQIDFELNFDKIGLHTFDVIIESKKQNELNQNNNKQSGAIQVKNSKTKMVIISDRLNWDAKFIIDAIKQNSRWEHRFLLKNNDLFDGRKKIKLSELDNIGLIILINNGKLKISNYEKKLINNFYKNEGNLVLIGKPISAFENISPAIASRISNSFNAVFKIGKNGERYDSFSMMNNNIPPVDYYYVREKVQSQILAFMDNEEKSPAILLDSSESILQFVFTGLYKWQLWDENGDYNNFIYNIISWMEQKKTNRFIGFTNKNIYYNSEPVNITLQAFDEKLSPIRDINAKLTIMDENGKIILEKFMIRQDDEYKSQVTSLIPNKYKYQISAEKLALKTSGQFIVSSTNSENYDKNFNIPLLKFIGEQSRGKMISLNEIDNFQIYAVENFVEKIIKEIPIYKKWYIITLFLLSFCLELFFRKRWGLL